MNSLGCYTCVTLPYYVLYKSFLLHVFIEIGERSFTNMRCNVCTVE